VKPAPFEYHAPERVEEVLDLLAAHGDEAKPLAGGQSLVPMLALRLTRFPHLVDLNRVAALAGVTRDDGPLVIGAMTRQADVEGDGAVAAAAPLLARATPLIGHFQIRNRGTVGGSIAHADPAAEYPAVALALDAEVEIAAKGGTRRLAARDLFVGTWTTALEPDELLVSMRLPVWGDGSGFAVEEVARREGDFALAGVACAVRVDGGGRVERAGLGLFGVGPTPVRAEAAEASLVGEPTDGVDPTEVGRLATNGLDPPSDVHASGAYRIRVTGHLVEQAVRRALGEARGG